MTTPYRDDREALEERLASLQAELGRVKEKLSSLGEEQRSADALEKEITALRAQLEDRYNRPLLENVKIAAPCPAEWGKMEGNDQVRFCPSCSKNVYNLSSLSRVEAERLLKESGESPPCVRLYKRRDGTVITNDCPVGLKRRRFRRIVAASIGGGLLAAGAMLARWRTSSCGMMTQGEVVMQGSPAPMMTDTAPVMGKIAMPPPSPSGTPTADPEAKPPQFATPPGHNDKR